MSAPRSQASNKNPDLDLPNRNPLQLKSNRESAFGHRIHFNRQHTKQPLGCLALVQSDITLQPPTVDRQAWGALLPLPVSACPNEVIRPGDHANPQR